MVRGCQTCLRVIKDPSEGLYIKNFDSSLDAIPLKEKLMDCVPELVLDSVDNAVLCNSCVENLMVAYRFKQRCLETQEKIHGFLQQLPVSNEMDIGKIAVHYQRLEIIAQGGDPTLADPSSSNIKRVKMPYNCTLCSFSSLDECVIRQHEILHKTEFPPYKCDQCFSIFPTAELLLDHLATHSNERPYSCSLCDFVTSVHDNLKEHGWVHRKAFQCNICWNRFSQRKELDAHMEFHNYELEATRYQCGWCEFRCDSLKTLRYHLYNNHPHTYNCKLCTVKCRTHPGLMEHMTRTHKELTEASEEVDVYENISYHLNEDIVIVPDDEDEINKTIACENVETLSMIENTKPRELEQQEDTRKCCYTCRKCSVDFKSRGSLKDHSKKCQIKLTHSHSGEFREKLANVYENSSSDSNKNADLLFEGRNKADSASDVQKTTSDCYVSDININHQFEGMFTVDKASESISKPPDERLIQQLEAFGGTDNTVDARKKIMKDTVVDPARLRNMGSRIEVVNRFDNLHHGTHKIVKTRKNIAAKSFKPKFFTCGNCYTRFEHRRNFDNHIRKCAVLVGSSICPTGVTDPIYAQKPRHRNTEKTEEVFTCELRRYIANKHKLLRKHTKTRTKLDTSTQSNPSSLVANIQGVNGTCGANNSTLVENLIPNIQPSLDSSHVADLNQNANRTPNLEQQKIPNLGSTTPGLNNPNQDIFHQFSFIREYMNIAQKINRAEVMDQNAMIVVDDGHNLDMSIQKLDPNIHQLSNTSGNIDKPKMLLKCKQCSFECESRLERGRHFRLYHSKYGQAKLQRLNSSIDAGHQEMNLQVFDSNTSSDNTVDVQTIMPQQNLTMNFQSANLEQNVVIGVELTNLPQNMQGNLQSNINNSDINVQAQEKVENFQVTHSSLDMETKHDLSKQNQNQKDKVLSQVPQNMERASLKRYQREICPVSSAKRSNMTKHRKTHKQYLTANPETEVQPKNGENMKVNIQQNTNKVELATIQQALDKNIPPLTNVYENNGSNIEVIDLTDQDLSMNSWDTKEQGGVESDILQVTDVGGNIELNMQTTDLLQNSGPTITNQSIRKSTTSETPRSMEGKDPKQLCEVNLERNLEKNASGSSVAQKLEGTETLNENNQAKENVSKMESTESIQELYRCYYCPEMMTSHGDLITHQAEKHTNAFELDLQALVSEHFEVIGVSKTHKVLLKCKMCSFKCLPPKKAGNHWKFTHSEWGLAKQRQRAVKRAEAELRSSNQASNTDIERKDLNPLGVQEKANSDGMAKLEENFRLDAVQMMTNASGDIDQTLQMVPPLENMDKDIVCQNAGISLEGNLNSNNQNETTNKDLSSSNQPKGLRKCRRCSLEFETRKARKCHWREVHSRRSVEKLETSGPFNSPHIEHGSLDTNNCALNVDKFENLNESNLVSKTKSIEPIQKVYQCYLCPETRTNRRDIRDHRRQAHEKLPLSTLECEKLKVIGVGKSTDSASKLDENLHLDPVQMTKASGNMDPKFQMGPSSENMDTNIACENAGINVEGNLNSNNQDETTNKDLPLSGQPKRVQKCTRCLLEFATPKDRKYHWKEVHSKSAQANIKFPNQDSNTDIGPQDLNPLGVQEKASNDGISKLDENLHLDPVQMTKASGNMDPKLQMGPLSENMDTNIACQNAGINVEGNLNSNNQDVTTNKDLPLSDQPKRVQKCTRCLLEFATPKDRKYHWKEVHSKSAQANIKFPNQDSNTDIGPQDLNPLGVQEKASNDGISKLDENLHLDPVQMTNASGNMDSKFQMGSLSENMDTNITCQNAGINVEGNLNSNNQDETINKDLPLSDQPKRVQKCRRCLLEFATRKDLRYHWKEVHNKLAQANIKFPNQDSNTDIGPQDLNPLGVQEKASNDGISKLDENLHLDPVQMTKASGNMDPKFQMGSLSENMDTNITCQNAGINVEGNLNSNNQDETTNKDLPLSDQPKRVQNCRRCLLEFATRKDLRYHWKEVHKLEVSGPSNSAHIEPGRLETNNCALNVDKFENLKESNLIVIGVRKSADSNAPQNVLKCTMCSFKCVDPERGNIHWKWVHSKWAQANVKFLNQSSNTDIGPQDSNSLVQMTNASGNMDPKLQIGPSSENVDTDSTCQNSDINVEGNLNSPNQDVATNKDLPLNDQPKRVQKCRRCLLEFATSKDRKYHWKVVHSRSAQANIKFPNESSNTDIGPQDLNPLGVQEKASNDGISKLDENLHLDPVQMTSASGNMDPKLQMGSSSENMDTDITCQNSDINVEGNLNPPNQDVATNKDLLPNDQPKRVQKCTRCLLEFATPKDRKYHWKVVHSRSAQANIKFPNQSSNIDIGPQDLNPLGVQEKASNDGISKLDENLHLDPVQMTNASGNMDPKLQMGSSSENMDTNITCQNSDTNVEGNLNSPNQDVATNKDLPLNDQPKRVQKCRRCLLEFATHKDLRYHWKEVHNKWAQANLKFPNQDSNTDIGPQDLNPLGIQEKASNDGISKLDENLHLDSLQMTSASGNVDPKLQMGSSSENMDTDITINVEGNLNSNNQDETTNKDLPLNDQPKRVQKCRRCLLEFVTRKDLKYHWKEVHSRSVEKLETSGPSTSAHIERGSLGTNIRALNVDKFEKNKLPENICSNIQTTNELKNIFLSQLVNLEKHLDKNASDRDGHDSLGTSQSTNATDQSLDASNPTNKICELLNTNSVDINVEMGKKNTDDDENSAPTGVGDKNIVGAKRKNVATTIVSVKRKKLDINYVENINVTDEIPKNFEMTVNSIKQENLNTIANDSANASTSNVKVKQEDFSMEVASYQQEAIKKENLETTGVNIADKNPDKAMMCINEENLDMNVNVGQHKNHANDSTTGLQNLQSVIVAVKQEILDNSDYDIM